MAIRGVLCLLIQSKGGNSSMLIQHEIELLAKTIALKKERLISRIDSLESVDAALLTGEVVALIEATTETTTYSLNTKHSVPSYILPTTL